MLQSESISYVSGANRIRSTVGSYGAGAEHRVNLAVYPR